MSGSDDKEANKGRLSLRPSGRLELGRTVDAGRVRESFPHGRSKVVQVEVRKKRASVGMGTREDRELTAAELAVRQRALDEQKEEAERRAREQSSILAAADEARKLEENARRHAEELERRLAAEERRKAEARTRTAAHIKRLSSVDQEPVGARWVERSESIAMDPAGDSSDSDAAAEPLMQQLHAAVVRNAKQFLPLAVRLDNSPGWQGISAAARALVENVDCDAGSLHLRLGFIYEATLALGSFIEQDNRLQRAKDAFSDPLEPEVRRSLSHLIRTAAPWLRGFPTVTALDDAAGAFLTNDELLGLSTKVPEAAKVLEAAKSTNVISSEDAVRVAVLMGAAERGEFQGKKAKTRVVGSAKNLLIAGARIAAAFYIGATASAFSSRSELVKRVGDFISETTMPIEKLIIDLPSDIRFAFATLIEQLKTNPPAGNGPHIPLDDSSAAISVSGQKPSVSADIDVDAEACRVILNGELPPESWRPFVRQINLSGSKKFEATALLTGLSNLQVLNLRGTRVHDVTPLARLICLESLDLVNTRVHDIAPLASLANLRSLDLRGTPVDNVAPLAALTNLQSLDLKGTRVKDVRPLSDLKKLTIRR